jgi:hypothetical protein
MVRKFFIGVGTAIAVGCLGWAVGQIAEGFKWLPLVLVPVSIVALGCIWAV